MTGPVPIIAPPPIRLTMRVYPPDRRDGTWLQLLAHRRYLLELTMMRNLAPTPWSILDGDVTFDLGDFDSHGVSELVGTWTWRQR